jgi:hypothetical protein
MRYPHLLSFVLQPLELHPMALLDVAVTSHTALEFPVTELHSHLQPAATQYHTSPQGFLLLSRPNYYSQHIEKIVIRA